MIFPEDFMKVEPIRTGSVGRAVRMLQARMGLPQTGTFSTLNAEALAAWQQRKGIQADGVYGPETNRWMTVRSPDALQALAYSSSVELAALQTVLQVETAGGGFLDNGLPKILLERHKVWRMSTPAQRVQLDPGVCNEQPGGYQGGSREWGRYTQVAAVIGEPAAIACCSWGLPQIMGANYGACGTPSATEFARQMCLNEDAQILLWGRFLESNVGLVTALIAKDWATFARLYNGPANVAVYAARLASAYGAG